MVGENGAELVKLPQGSRVFNHQTTKNMMGGTTINTNVTINATKIDSAEIKRIAQKIGDEINMKINRSVNSLKFG